MDAPLDPNQAYPSGTVPGEAPAPAAAMSPQTRAMIAQALMGGMGGMGGGGNANSFAGGLAQGVNPMLKAMMQARMMQQMSGGVPAGGVQAPPGFMPPVGPGAQ